MDINRFLYNFFTHEVMNKLKLMEGFSVIGDINHEEREEHPNAGIVDMKVVIRNPETKQKYVFNRSVNTNSSGFKEALLQAKNEFNVFIDRASTKPESFEMTPEQEVKDTQEVKLESYEEINPGKGTQEEKVKNVEEDSPSKEEGDKDGKGEHPEAGGTKEPGE